MGVKSKQEVCLLRQRGERSETGVCLGIIPKLFRRRRRSTLRYLRSALFCWSTAENVSATVDRRVSAAIAVTSPQRQRLLHDLVEPTRSARPHRATARRVLADGKDLPPPPEGIARAARRGSCERGGVVGRRRINYVDQREKDRKKTRTGTDGH